MKALHDAIEKQAAGIGDSIVRVDMFLNHLVDTTLINQMGAAFHQAFQDTKVDLLLTAESSGIAPALATAQAFGNLPLLVAKKGKPSTMQDANVYQSRVYSYTHRTENILYVNKKYLPQDANVLIIDDFLANGAAARGLTDIVKQAGAHVAGIGICIEKGFQPGGAKLRGEGYHVVSLATVDAIQDGKVLLRKEA